MSSSKPVAEKKKPATHYGHLLTGGLAGAISRSATSPLERLRILQQTTAKGFEGLGTIKSLQRMYTHEGMLGLFKGNGATVLKIAPFSAAEFYYYEVYKNMFFPGKTRNELKFWEKMIAGGVTGMTAQTLTYPLDLLKTYLTINIENNSRVSMWEQSKIIVGNRGFFGMFQGLGTSLFGIAPFIGIKMATYDYLMQHYGPKKGDPKTVYYNLVLGATAGTIAVTGTYPIDLVRRLIQLNGSPGHSYAGLQDCIKQTFAKDGIYGFYRGLWATYLKVAPMTAILFLTNDTLKRMAGI